MAKSQIKVSSIMFTDIVDYSKMVQRDQALALELVEEHNQIIKGNIENLSGKIIKFTGDGFMAEFDSSTSAVTAPLLIISCCKGDGVLPYTPRNLDLAAINTCISLTLLSGIMKTPFIPTAAVSYLVILLPVLGLTFTFTIP